MTARTALLLAFVVALMLAPPAYAQSGEVIDIKAVELPARTVGQHSFSINVTIENRGNNEENVTLFAALYAPRAESPCGAAQSPRFRAFTHLIQPVIRVPAKSTITFPEPGQKWPQLYLPSDAEGPETNQEFCVFAAKNAQTQTIDYYDFQSLDLYTRPTNSPPSPSFTFSPAGPMAAESVRFVANGSDTDGDPLTFTWDFGHANATGRARATGIEASHPFYPEGTYTVTLTASDGFEERSVSQTVTVRPEPAVPSDVTPTKADGRASIPDPIVLTILALVGVSALRRVRAAR